MKSLHIRYRIIIGNILCLICILSCNLNNQHKDNNSNQNSEASRGVIDTFKIDSNHVRYVFQEIVPTNPKLNAIYLEQVKNLKEGILVCTFIKIDRKKIIEEIYLFNYDSDSVTYDNTLNQSKYNQIKWIGEGEVCSCSFIGEKAQIMDTTRK